MSAHTSSTNPVVQAIVAGTASAQARLMAARGMLPLAGDELLEVLVTLRADADQEIVAAADETLHTQTAEMLLEVAQANATSPAVLSYLAGRADVQTEIHEAVTLNAGTPDAAIAVLALSTTDGALLELITINQQRLIRAPDIIEAVLHNPARTNDAERRAKETKREFFEKERGAQQIAGEMRARGMNAAAEFVEASDSIGTGTGLTYEDAWLIAQHIEVSDADIDDSWLPLERLEEFSVEDEEQRLANIERIIAETASEPGQTLPALSAQERAAITDSLKEAAASLETYLKLFPNAPGAEQLREQVETLRLHSSSISESGDTPIIYKADAVTTKAQIISRPEPLYTEEARQRGIKGTVRLRMVCSFDGKVRHILVMQGLGGGLTEMAMNAARQMRFTPAMQGGRPVSQFITIEYNFNIY